MRELGWISTILCVAALGCGGLPFRASGPTESPFVDNPLFVPQIDREFMWSQLVDVTDDYFKIEREDRVRSINGVLTEGRIETRPTVGSTLLEPWRGDSTYTYEKAHATLQSIRRRAIIRVIPNEAGYLVDVTVHKELEDLDKPENATAGGAAVRHDGTIVRTTGQAGRYSVTLGWIPLGRDTSLEQKMLADIRGRLRTVADLPPSNAAGPPQDGPEFGPSILAPETKTQRLPTLEEVAPGPRNSAP